uniref:Uncharacterized protein n=1 Tax=Gasterosteus aculeatus TaxID=69293 RepID=G3P669_GASAC
MHILKQHYMMQPIGPCHEATTFCDDVDNVGSSNASSLPLSSQQARFPQHLIQSGEQLFCEVSQSGVNVKLLQRSLCRGTDWGVNDSTHIWGNLKHLSNHLEHFMYRGLLHHPVAERSSCG